MSGTFAGKVLAEGQVASSKGTLYTVPANTVAYIKSLTVFNTNTTNETVIIYLKPGATSRKWRKYILTPDESADALDLVGPIILEAGDLIEAETTTASKVDYVITGVEET